MGANIIPIKKNSGSTVLGVKMGLVVFYQRPTWRSDPAGKDSSSHTAMLSNVVVGTRYLDVVRSFIMLEFWRTALQAAELPCRWAYLLAFCSSPSSGHWQGLGRRWTRSGSPLSVTCRLG